MLPRRRKTDSSTRLPRLAASPAAGNPAAAGFSLTDCTTLDSAGTLVVNGTVTAPITHDHDVTIGPSGRVTGKIRARAIVVEGEVSGDLHAGDFIRVTATGRVCGDLHAVRISAQTGAQLRGRIIMRQRPDQSQHLDDSSVDRLLTQL
jgi:cytoskeletal protein CcmA (bactofilin family)